ncbi:hypothetical protein FRB95_005053 [Tulasnella sp. JGI-2019a]|nr:hypothetical protein FRB95_005053 [Tulasnella sp. JGI-2019a]
MDWGNAIVTSKTVSPSGTVEAITMKLHLEGDFKKTKKKITWLAESTPTNTLTPITLIDYDYLITKKKLEETDSVEDCVTPQTEFKTACWADANVLQKVKLGDIIQFERKGYYICDCVADQDRHMDFVKIPDGKLTSLASKAGGVSAVPVASADGATKDKASPWGKSGAPKKGGPPATSTAADAPNSEKTVLSEGAVGFGIPIITNMYDVKRVYGEGEVIAKADTKMYEVTNVYAVQDHTPK